MSYTNDDRFARQALEAERRRLGMTPKSVEPTAQERQSEQFGDPCRACGRPHAEHPAAPDTQGGE